MPSFFLQCLQSTSLQFWTNYLNPTLQILSQIKVCASRTRKFLQFQGTRKSFPSANESLLRLSSLLTLYTIPKHSLLPHAITFCTSHLSSELYLRAPPACPQASQNLRLNFSSRNLLLLPEGTSDHPVSWVKNVSRNRLFEFVSKAQY